MKPFWENMVRRSIKYKTHPPLSTMIGTGKMIQSNLKSFFFSNFVFLHKSQTEAHNRKGKSLSLSDHLCVKCSNLFWHVKKRT